MIRMSKSSLVSAFLPLAILVLGVGTGHALQGGPTMPEYVKFEPYDMTDIVNLNTGDFVYSVPLGDVPGPAGSFPITMSYHAGVGHDQEATWVGLGWTLNPGAINRMLRGYPDDVHNSASLSYVYARDYHDGWGVNIGAGWGPCGLNMTYDSHKGWGGAVSLGYGVGPYSAGMDIGSNGVGVNAQIGAVYVAADNTGISAGIGFKGEGAVAANASMGVHRSWGGKVSAVGGVGLGYQPVPSNTMKTTLVGYGFNSGSPTGGSFSIAGSGSASISYAGGGVTSFSEYSGRNLTIPLPYGFWAKVGWNHYEHEMKVSEATAVSMYGYMYQGGKGVRVNSIKDIGNGSGDALAKTAVASSSAEAAEYSNFLWSNRGPTLENIDLSLSTTIPGDADLVNGTNSQSKKYWMTAPSYDVFSAAGPGISGAFRPFAKHPMEMYQSIFKMDRRDALPTPQNFLMRPRYAGTNSQGQSLVDVNSQEPRVFPDPHHSDRRDIPDLTADDIYFNDGNPAAPEEDFYFCNDGHVAYDKVQYDRAAVLNNFLSRAASASTEDDCSPYAFLWSNIRNQRNRLVFSADDRERYRATDHTNIRFGFLDEAGEADMYQFGDTLFWSYGGRQIIPLIEGAEVGSESSGRLKGFKIVDADGKQFLYERPVYSLFQVDYSTNNTFGMPLFNRGTEDKFSWQVQVTPFATQWLLTEVRGADFIKISDKDMSQNYGYQVKLDYTDPVRYNWRAPYAPPDMASNLLPNFEIPGKKLYAGSMGQKELIYLEGIETATHKAVFNLNDPNVEERNDAREWKTKWFEQSGQNGHPLVDIPITMVFKYQSVSSPTGSSAHLWEHPEESKIALPEPHESYGQHRLYGASYTYQCNQVYLPFKPTPEQLDKILIEGIQISGFNVALTYFQRFDEDNQIGVRPVGPSVVSNIAGYQSYSVSSATPTLGNEEKLGAYRLTLATPITSTSNFNDWNAPTEYRTNRQGDVIIGPNSWWESEGRRYPMDARQRADNNDNEQLRPYYRWTHYADHLAPLPPRMNLGNLYANSVTRNQARYLKSVDLYKKDHNTKLRSFEFAYDYSLCNRTPNSYPAPASPAVYPSSTTGLTGKLTLKSITEAGYDLASGAKHYLPPYDFVYQGDNHFQGGGNPDYYEWNGMATNTDAFKNALASSTYRSDAYGSFNPFGTGTDQKIRKSGNKGVTWNLARINNPLGGELQIAYERDTWLDHDFNPFNGVRGDAFIGRYGSPDFNTSTAGNITFMPLTSTFLNSIWNSGDNAKYFGGMASQGDALAKYNFANPSYPAYAANEPVMVVFKGYYFYETPNDHHGHSYYAATARVLSVGTDGKIELSLKPADLPSQRKIWNDNNKDEANLGTAGVPFAAIYRLAKKQVEGGDIRVKSLTSCYTDCQITAYAYEDGSAATRPDSLASIRWIGRNLLTPHATARNYSAGFVDKAQMGLGKSASNTPGGDIDMAFLPSSPIAYGKVTVANVNPFVCAEIRTDLKNCITNGKTVYRFHPAQQLPGIANPILTATDQPFTDPYWGTAKQYIGTIYDDKTSMIGRPKSVTYYGSQWNASVTPNRTDFHLVSKDSTEYAFGKAVSESWMTFKAYLSNPADEKSATGYAGKIEYRRYPSRISRQIKYQFVTKVPGQENAASVPHLAATVFNDSWDKLTGNVLASHVEYKDGLDPLKVKVKTTTVTTMAAVADADGSAGLPKEMKRRNMLSQPFSEVVDVKLKSGGATTMLDYKASLWAESDNGGGLRTASLYKSGDLKPTLPMPVTGNPAKAYSTGYDFSTWAGDRVTKVDRHLHPLEVKLANGSYASSYYAADGVGQVGFVADSKYGYSKAMTFSPNTAANPDWEYQNGAQYRDGNFFLQKSGAAAPVVFRMLPIPANVPGAPNNNGDYIVRFRAKSRAANASLSVDFFSSLGSQSYEGPQANFTVTPTWQVFSARLSLAGFGYGGPSISALLRRGLNRLRLFNDNPANTGIDYDILIDQLAVLNWEIGASDATFGDWHFYNAQNMFTMTKNTLHGDWQNHLTVPVDLRAPGSGIYTVEFRARANEEDVPLEMVFCCGWSYPGDTKQVSIGKQWKKYKVDLDSKIGFEPENRANAQLMMKIARLDYLRVEFDYARVYPKEALANSFVVNARGMITESIDENQVSTRYTFDPFGRLNGIQNDSGFVLGTQNLNYGKK
jgi:hypothetical protein